MFTPAKKLSLKFYLLLFFGLTFFVLVLLHTPGINGPEYWKWHWKKLPHFSVYPGMFLAAAPFFLGQFLFYRNEKFLILSLLLVMLSSIALQFNGAFMNSNGFAFERIWKIVENPLVTSYYTDALRSAPYEHSFKDWFTGYSAADKPNLKDWLTAYPEMLPYFYGHSRNKPPGPILYYLGMITTFGLKNHMAALSGGIIIGIISSFSIPAVYFLIRCFGGKKIAAFCGASYLALCPGFILFFPEFDQIYPIFTVFLLSFWILALKNDSLIYSFAFGLVLSIVCFWSYSILVTGFFVVLYGLYFYVIKSPKQYTLLLKHSLAGILIFIAFYLALWLFFQYDPIETFLINLKNQKRFLANNIVNRPYPETIVFDLLDFALGAGWLAALLVLFLFWKPLSYRLFPQPAIVVICLLQILVVAIGGLIQGETARVWIFLLPVLMFPVGLELSSWKFSERNLVYLLLLLIVCAIGQNMLFIYPDTK